MVLAVGSCGGCWIGLNQQPQPPGWRGVEALRPMILLAYLTIIGLMTLIAGLVGLIYTGRR
jgi:hypothetical protein